MIYKGVEGRVSRNGLTIFPWYHLVLKLGRRFILRWDETSIALIVDTRRDHSMYRRDDIPPPALTCRRCGVYTPFWVIGELDRGEREPKENPKGYCSGKIHEWSRGSRK